ncbi:MAG: putative metal-binding motif-containing protein [Myxococcota bacterium]
MTMLLLSACFEPKEHDTALGDTSFVDSATTDTDDPPKETGDSGVPDTEETGCTAVYYADHDGDGFGNPDETVVACDPPAGTADNGADCDDTDAGVHPGAADEENDVDDDCDGELDEDAAEPVPTTVDLTWSASGVTVDVAGEAPGYELGMAETGAGALGWFGESCVAGDEPYGYDDYGWDVCHGLGATGGFVESVYPDVSAVRDGYTLFAQEHEASLTYVLLDTSSSACWVWGDDVGYYGDFGCTEL